MNDLKKLQKAVRHMPFRLKRKLKKEQIQGYRNNMFDCPIAIYLQKQTQLRIGVSHGQASIIGTAKYVKLPARANRFIRDFDESKLPEFQKSIQ